MKFTAALFVAIAFSCAFESVSATFYGPATSPAGFYGPAPSPAIEVEQLGRGFVFLCEVIPALSCVDIVYSLPPQSSLSQAAAAISQVASTMILPNVGGFPSQNPASRSRVYVENLGYGYAFACALIPAIDCDAIIQQLPPNANESDAGSEIARQLAALRLPGQDQYLPNYYGPPQYAVQRYPPY